MAFKCFPYRKTEPSGEKSSLIFFHIQNARCYKANLANLISIMEPSMNSATLGIFGLVSFLLAYRFYSKYLSVKIFKLNDNDETPATLMQDGIDYVPTDKSILIGHHFSSIAGAAPIVGPAVAAIWGWLPAVLWIVFGVIFIGASHDFGALILSMKNGGGSIAKVAESLLGKRSKLLFLVVIFFLVWMVIAVFTLVIANLFIKFPASVLPVNFEIIIALIIGMLFKYKKIGLTLPSILAQITLFLMIYLGTQYPLSLATYFGGNEMMVWIVFLMIYSFIASTLPVWALLQPRDYINSHQLMLGLGMMILGLLITAPPVVAPAFNPHPVGAPPWFPFLFITIACGAVSGFHGLVAGGTTSKQVRKFTDARPIAYGSMLGEGLLALLATLAVTAGFKTTQDWHQHYASWDQANGLGAKIGAFVTGAGQFVSGVGIDTDIAQTIIAVLIISFAATSLDTACRIQRYILSEFGESANIKILKNRYFSSLIAVGSAFALMISSDGGKGGLKLWPLFGATNQMLAGLTLVLITVYLKKMKRKTLHFLIPAVFVMLITVYALGVNIKMYINQGNYFLIILGSLLFLAQLWIIAESFITLRGKGT